MARLWIEAAQRIHRTAAALHAVAVAGKGSLPSLCTGLAGFFTNSAMHTAVHAALAQAQGTQGEREVGAELGVAAKTAVAKRQEHCGLCLSGPACCMHWMVGVLWRAQGRRHLWCASMSVRWLHW